MKYLGLLTLFLGYLLVYAATANHGRFALHPWLGLLGDAYTGDVLLITQNPPAGSSSSSPPESAGPAMKAAKLQPATVSGLAA